jgi:hypothetical protein
MSASHAADLSPLFPPQKLSASDTSLKEAALKLG